MVVNERDDKYTVYTYLDFAVRERMHLMPISGLLWDTLIKSCPPDAATGEWEGEGVQGRRGM